MLDEEFDYNDEETLINMSEICIAICSHNKYKHKFKRPIIK